MRRTSSVLITYRARLAVGPGNLARAENRKGNFGVFCRCLHSGAMADAVHASTTLAPSPSASDDAEPTSTDAHPASTTLATSPSSEPVLQASKKQGSTKRPKGAIHRAKGKQKAVDKKKMDLAKREKTAEGMAELQKKANETLAKPLSAFMLFGFSQRGILKKQKEPIREVVKAVGERWMLLSHADRARYEAMADEEAAYLQRRAAQPPPSVIAPKPKSKPKPKPKPEPTPSPSAPQNDGDAKAQPHEDEGQVQVDEEDDCADVAEPARYNGDADERGDPNAEIWG